jgi:hypothetical protein
MKNPFSVRRLSTFFNNAFSRLMTPPSARGRNNILKMPREQLRRLTSVEKEVVGLSAGAAHLVPKSIKTVVARTTTVPVSAYNDAVAGVPHTRAAAERKAGVRGYGTAAAEEQAKKTVLTRKFTRRFKRPEGWLEDVGSHEHAFRAVDAIGKHRAHAWFEGDDLIVMQNYRTDKKTAMETGDDNFLKRYDAIEIFDVNDKRVFPETDLGKLKAFEESLTESQRNLFDAEVNYIVKEAA